MKTHLSDKSIIKIIGIIVIMLIIGLGILFNCSSCCIVSDIQYTIEHKGEPVIFTVPYYVHIVYTNDSTLLDQ